jgi:hypothetical protein
VLRTLRPGTRIKITQTVRVGSTATWTTQVTGTFRDVNFLATGLATDRVPEDDIVVVTVHFTKDNGELSSVTLDENSRIEVVSVPARHQAQGTNEDVSCPPPARRSGSTGITDETSRRTSTSTPSFRGAARASASA